MPMRFKWIKGLLPAVWLCTACAGLHRAPRVAAPPCVLRAADSVGTVTEWTAETISPAPISPASAC